jgi:hypothetical protein
VGARARLGPKARVPAHRMSRHRLSATTRSRNAYVGWRRDPYTPRLLRWWDGNDWTDVVRPRSPTVRTAARTIGRRGPSGKLPLSDDARRALLILLAATCVYTGWAYQNHMAALKSNSRNATEPATVDNATYRVVDTGSSSAESPEKSSSAGQIP